MKFCWTAGSDLSLLFAWCGQRHLAIQGKCFYKCGSVKKKDLLPLVWRKNPSDTER